MKHLSLTSRCMIEQYIAYGYSFREIADMLGYQPSTISREVKKYRTFVMPKSPTCAKYGECRNKSHCTMAECTDYQVPHCKKLDKALFVCNSCPSQDFCSREQIDICFRFNVAVATAVADSMVYDKKRKAA